MGEPDEGKGSWNAISCTGHETVHAQAPALQTTFTKEMLTSQEDSSLQLLINDEPQAMSVVKSQQIDARQRQHLMNVSDRLEQASQTKENVQC